MNNEEFKMKLDEISGAKYKEQPFPAAIDCLIAVNEKGNVLLIEVIEKELDPCPLTDYIREMISEYDTDKEEGVYKVTFSVDASRDYWGDYDEELIFGNMTKCEVIIPEEA